MSERSSTPDLVERARRAFEAGARQDYEAVVSDYGPDSVWDMAPMGLGTYKGPEAIRRFIEDWQSSYQQFDNELEEALDLGNGVAFVVVRMEGRPVDSDAVARLRYASIGEWVGDVLMRITNYSDVEEARAIAERLARSRGQGMQPEQTETEG